MNLITKDIFGAFYNIFLISIKYIEIIDSSEIKRCNGILFTNFMYQVERNLKFDYYPFNNQ